MIGKLLVANRGEIAVRVIRAAREMGIRTVAVASEPDRLSMHAKIADETIIIGPGQASESYLNIERILEAARISGADAIHPGYGFLSERAEFSRACRDAGFIFVGPSPESMLLLGSKSAAKTIALKEHVPIVPGLFTVDASIEELERAAAEIGYPVMLKASAGGGGRGMRVVRDPSDFRDEWATASDEALRSFGDGAMMVEKLVDRPRHIEVQLLADSHGNVVCLFERECSLQRRHQKLVEEAPSPYMAEHPELWDEIKIAAARLARASGYVGAGTVEFMLDQSDGKFYFLEVNTRLQVEHPVTEFITGLDLVKWQLRIADGLPIEFDQALSGGDRRAIVGHSIEARIVAESPETGFLPSTGRIEVWAEPQAPGVRVDTGFSAGNEISGFYDSLIAKVIVHAETRPEAIEKLRLALLDFHIIGVKTNIGYLLDVIGHSAYGEGRVDTGFLGREFGEWQVAAPAPELGDLVTFGEGQSIERPAGMAPARRSAWETAQGFRNSG